MHSSIAAPDEAAEGCEQPEGLVTAVGQDGREC
jgi:hypothetical protein